MRNFKRTLALVLAFIMIVGTFATVSAAKNEVWYDVAVESLDNLGISNIGNSAAQPITRNEFVLWIAKIEHLLMSDNAWKQQVNSVAFTDVTTDHYNAAIASAHKLGYIVGNGDGTFGPDDTLLLGEASAVIVRLMRYEDKLIGIDEGHWANPYFTTAARYCNAFDQVFYKNTDTANMDYQLNKGEAAYLLYTICNLEEGKDKNKFSLTADGTNLGSRLEGLGNNMVRSEIYYVTEMLRDSEANKFNANASVGLGTATPGVDDNGIPTGSWTFTYDRGTKYTNQLSEDGYVTLVNFDKNKVIKIANDEFLKAARVDMGLAAVRDYLNEEEEVNVFAHINVGTMVNVNVSSEFKTVDKYNAQVGVTPVTSIAGVDLVFNDDPDTLADEKNSDKIEIVVIDNYSDIVGLTANKNSVVVDTVLQLGAGEKQFVGFSALEVYDSTVHKSGEYWRLTLPGSVSVDNVTKWSDVKTMSSQIALDNESTVKVDESEFKDVVVSATLTFQGVEYDYSYFAPYTKLNSTEDNLINVYSDIDDSEIEIYDADFNLLYVEDAMKKLINVAQGECYAVFNDVDGDGEYDNVVIMESYPFHIAADLNVGPYHVEDTSGDSSEIYNSVNGGKLLTDEFGQEIIWNMKRNAIGSVVYDMEVTASSTERCTTDAFNLEATTDEDAGFNKLQLVLVGYNARPTNATDKRADYYEVPNYYTTVELATIQNGIVEKVSVSASKEYYTAQIRVGDTLKTVKIPVEAPETIEMDVTVAGVTETYNFYSARWFDFLEQAEVAVAEGIVSGTADEDIKAATAAWMAGRYVRFIANEKNEVIFLSAPVETTTVGLLSNVTKTTTGDNTYNVTVLAYEMTANVNELLYYSTEDTFTKGAIMANSGNSTPSRNYGNYLTIESSHNTIFEIDDVEYVETRVGLSVDTGTPTSTSRPATAKEKAENAGLVSVKTTVAKKAGIYISAKVSELENVTIEGGKVIAGTVGDNTTLIMSNCISTVTTVYYVYETGYEEAKETSTVFTSAGYSTVTGADGKKYWVDDKGERISYYQEYRVQPRITKTVTKEVRAAASGAFDIDNKKLYNEIFQSGLLINEAANGHAIEGIVNGRNDLIEVKLIANANGAYIVAANLSTCNTYHDEDALPEGETLCDAIFHEQAESTGYTARYPKPDPTDTSYTTDIYYVSGKAGQQYLFRNYTKQVIEVKLPEEWMNLDNAYRLGTTERVAERIYFKEISFVIDEDTTPEDIVNATVFDPAKYNTGYILATTNEDEAIGYIGSYNSVYGVDPYYNRTWDAETESYEYELFYGKVITDTNVKSIAMFAVDTAKTYMIQLFVGEGSESKPVIADTPAKKAEFPATEYYIDANNQVFKVLEGTKITYKTDKDGKFVNASNEFIYSAEDSVNTVVVENIPFANDLDKDYLAQGLINTADESKGYKALKPYANFKVDEAEKTANGWFPGLYTLTINDKNYVATEATEVVIVTPSEDGFEISTTTLKALKSTEGLFITNWEANTAATDVVISTIAVIGELVNSSDKPEEKPAENENRLVYLDGTASAFIDFDEYADLWTVVSDKDAYLLPSGEAIGVIKKEYTTYTDAKAAVVDLALKGGEWYYVDADNTVAGSASVSAKTATITSATYNGTVLATVEGTKNVDVSAKNVVFFFIKDGALTIASDSTNVSVTTADAFDKLDDDLEKALAKAEDNYEDAKDKYNNVELSKERLDYYKGLVDDAEAALEAAQEANFAKYRDGQFWGYANNAVYKYLQTQKGVFQNQNPTVSFDYVMIGDTMCVLTDSFK